MIGQTISHYKILEKLGAGGMGVVYKAQDLKLDRFVALKFLSPHLSVDKEEKKRFIQEAKTASALDHVNICTIYEIDETEDGQLFIAMTYYEGETLKKKVALGQLSVNSVIDIGIQMAQGLAKAHAHGIIHRDIKPANVIVTTEGVAKILDFGLAKLAGQSRLTKSGATLGTVAYMSPEQARGEEIDSRSDIWSLGAVLYEMLTGQLPFKGDHEQVMLYSIIHEKPQPITSLRSDLPLELERIVLTCLAKKPADRYQRIDELLTDLKREKKSTVAPVKAIRRMPWSKSKRAGIRPLIWSLALLTFAIMVVFYVFRPFSKTSFARIASIFLKKRAALVQLSDGKVAAQQKISATEGNFTGALNAADRFCVVASLGDLDRDGIEDIAIGAYGDDDGGDTRGAVWILFLNPNGSVKSHQKISATQGNFTGVLDNFDNFGVSVTALGDLDDDGIEDLAVGAWLDDDGNVDRGAVWILFMNTNGTVKSHQKISDTAGNFTTGSLNTDGIGRYLTALGDLNGDGVEDLAVSATYDDDGGPDRGAVWILFLNSNGTVKSYQKISAIEGGFTETLDNSDQFGEGLAALGDLDDDGVGDLAVGAIFDDDGGTDRGAVWILFMNTDGTVKSHQKISDTEGNFDGVLDNGDQFGRGTAGLGDLDGDGVEDLAVGAIFDDDGGPNQGAVWVLFLNSDGTVKSYQKISAIAGGFTGTLDKDDGFGLGIANIGDLNDDSITDLAVGAIFDDDGGDGASAVWILFMHKVNLIANTEPRH